MAADATKPSYRLNRSLARLRGGDAPGALRDAHSVYAQHPSQDKARYRFASALLTLGEFQEVQHVLAAAPENEVTTAPDATEEEEEERELHGSRRDRKSDEVNPPNPYVTDDPHGNPGPYVTDPPHPDPHLHPPSSHPRPHVGNGNHPHPSHHQQPRAFRRTLRALTREEASLLHEAEAGLSRQARHRHVVQLLAHTRLARVWSDQRRLTARESMLRQWKLAMAAPGDWDVEDPEWRPLWSDRLRYAPYGSLPRSLRPPPPPTTTTVDADRFDAPRRRTKWATFIGLRRFVTRAAEIEAPRRACLRWADPGHISAWEQAVLYLLREQPRARVVVSEHGLGRISRLLTRDSSSSSSSSKSTSISTKTRVSRRHYPPGEFSASTPASIPGTRSTDHKHDVSDGSESGSLAGPDRTDPVPQEGVKDGREGVVVESGTRREKEKGEETEHVEPEWVFAFPANQAMYRAVKAFASHMDPKVLDRDTDDDDHEDEIAEMDERICLHRIVPRRLVGSCSVGGAPPSRAHLPLSMRLFDVPGTSVGNHPTGAGGRKERARGKEGGPVSWAEPVLPSRADALVVDLLDHIGIGAGLLVDLDWGSQHLCDPQGRVMPMRLRLQGVLVDISMTTAPGTEVLAEGRASPGDDDVSDDHDDEDQEGERETGAFDRGGAASYLPQLDISAMNVYHWYPGWERIDLYDHHGPPVVPLSAPFLVSDIDLQARADGQSRRSGPTANPKHEHQSRERDGDGDGDGEPGQEMVLEEVDIRRPCVYDDDADNDDDDQDQEDPDQDETWEESTQQSVTLIRDGTVRAVLLWWEAELAPDVWLASWEPHLHLQPNPKIIPVAKTVGQALSWCPPIQGQTGQCVSVHVQRSVTQLVVGVRRCPGVWQTAIDRPLVKSNLVPRWHWSMLHDEARNEAYKRAIRDAVWSYRAHHRASSRSGFGPPPKVDEIHGVDLGAGSGLLAMMMARAGVDLVTAIEQMEHMCQVAERCVLANGLAHRVHVVHKDIRACRAADDHISAAQKSSPPAAAARSATAVIPPDLARRASLCVFELFDCGLIGEGVLHALHAAKQHLLTPDATIIPCGAQVHAVLLEWGPTGSPEMAPFRWSSTQTYEEMNLDRVTETWRPLSRPFVVTDFDFTRSLRLVGEFASVESGSTTYGSDTLRTTQSNPDPNPRVPPPSSWSGNLAVPITSPGRVNAIAFWFDLFLNDNETIGSGPKCMDHILAAGKAGEKGQRQRTSSRDPRSASTSTSTSTHSRGTWHQAVFGLPTTRLLRSGEVVGVEARHDTYSFTFAVREPRGEEEEEEEEERRERALSAEKNEMKETTKESEGWIERERQVVSETGSAVAKAMAQNPLEYRRTALVGMTMAARPGRFGLTEADAGRFCARMLG